MSVSSLSCCTASARMLLSNTSNRARPRSLARYIATSASRSISSGVPYGIWLVAMPMLTVTKTSCASIVKGVRKFCCTRSATARASSMSVPSSSMVNSSPPRRATVSPGRSNDSSRRAVPIRSWSPVMWPSESFTTLNRSRSRKSTANTGASPRCARRNN